MQGGHARPVLRPHALSVGDPRVPERTDVPCVLAVWLPEGRRPGSGHGLNPTNGIVTSPRRADGSVVWSFPIHDAETWTRPGFSDRRALREGVRSSIAEEALGWTLPR